MYASLRRPKKWAENTYFPFSVQSQLLRQLAVRRARLRLPLLIQMPASPPASRPRTQISAHALNTARDMTPATHGQKARTSNRSSSAAAMTRHFLRAVKTTPAITQKKWRTSESRSNRLDSPDSSSQPDRFQPEK